ncbi:MAG TPA: GyrI-like domain-containing protein [Xanthobacteraceae bacterium]|jgi:effector-binding domain-containing protein|nr:GyrI-like domain-containing protein [Xanthobacteraceae bacterium]
MSFRFAPRILSAVAAVAVTLAFALPASAQSPAAAPDQPAATPAQPGDPFGEGATLMAKPIIYVKGSGTWDKAFETISGAFKKVHAYIDKEGLKADGLPMTIFTSTDDNGFDFQAAIPIAEAPKNPPHGDLNLGQSPEGQALKFVHRGSYSDLDNTYEAITNYLDDKRMEAKDMFIEEYVTDPVSADANKLVVNVYVLIKQGQTSPG